MKEKKMIASVILGVALVSLITALVAALAESLTLFIDESANENINVDYRNEMGGVTLGAVVLGIVFVSVFFANKKYRFAVNLSLTLALVAYAVLSLIVLRCVRPKLNVWNYSLFVSYLSAAISLAVSTALTFAAWLYLTLVKKKEEPAPIEDGSETENQ